MATAAAIVVMDASGAVPHGSQLTFPDGESLMSSQGLAANTEYLHRIQWYSDDCVLSMLEQDADSSH